MAVGRAQRREERRGVFEERFGPDADVALDLIEVLEMAWHDVYAEITPPDHVIADLLTLADGRLDALVSACRLALADPRDLSVAARARRAPEG